MTHSGSPIQDTNVISDPADFFQKVRNIFKMLLGSHKCGWFWRKNSRKFNDIFFSGWIKWFGSSQTDLRRSEGSEDMPPEAPSRKSAITPDSFASSARPWGWEILGGASGPWKHISMVRSTDCAASAPLPKSSESEERHFLAGRIITLLDAGLFTGVVAVLPRVMNPVPKVVVVEFAPPSPRVMTPFPNFDVVVEPPALSRLM